MAAIRTTRAEFIWGIKNREARQGTDNSLEEITEIAIPCTGLYPTYAEEGINLTRVSN